ncbi:hypothetical protein BD626DRAFT_267951 [Schizophyllum amplum]|uniref:Uncharacterized protein n=1 Tax=Schizophyllum amplum TaxID=97359 RepID=A0A550BTZ7_9AGAR|nr:hypothetical protein BD626DRAFT_267951 [Auriculariopsis ampla]
MAFPAAIIQAPADQHNFYGPPPPPVGYPVSSGYHAGAALARAPPRPPLRPAPAPVPPLPPRPQPPARFDTANPFGNRACRHRCRTTGAWERGAPNINASTCLETRQDPLAALPSSTIPHGAPRTRCDLALGKEWGEVGHDGLVDGLHRSTSGLYRSKSLHAASGARRSDSVHGPLLRGYTARCPLAGAAGRQTVGFYDADQIAAALVRAAGRSAPDAHLEDKRLHYFVTQVLGRTQVQLSVALHAIMLLAPSSSLASAAPQQRLIAALALAHRAGTELGICSGCWAHVANGCSAGEGRAWLGNDAFVRIGSKDASAGGVAPFTKEEVRRNSEALLRGAGYRLHVERGELEEIAMSALEDVAMRADAANVANTNSQEYAEMPPRSQSAVPWLPPGAVARPVRSPEPSTSRYPEPPMSRYPEPSMSRSPMSPKSRPLDPLVLRPRTISLGEGARAAPGGRMLFHPLYRPSPLNAYNTGKSSYPPPRPRAQ